MHSVKISVSPIVTVSRGLKTSPKFAYAKGMERIPDPKQEFISVKAHAHGPTCTG